MFSFSFVKMHFSKKKKGQVVSTVGSTKSVDLCSDKSLKAFDGFYCEWKPLNLQSKHFSMHLAVASTTRICCHCRTCLV